MKLCASYHCKNARLDEIRYPIALLNNALELAMNNTEQTVIIEILSLAECELSLERILNLGNELNNIVYDCYILDDYVTLRQKHVPKVMYHYPITTYNNLWAILQLQPYAVVIGEPLNFDLAKVRKILDTYDNYIQIRVVPHIGRPSNWIHLSKQDNGLRHFWITPQTIHLYEPYVDILDLYDKDPVRENALVTTYDKGDYVFGLTSLLKNCESKIPCPMITEEMVNKRLNCRQTCMQLSTNCHYCDRIEDIVQLTKPNHS